MDKSKTPLGWPHASAFPEPCAKIHISGYVYINGDPTMNAEHVEPFEPLPDVIYDPTCEIFWFLGLPWCWWW
jgi:hypothetical protein